MAYSPEHIKEVMHGALILFSWGLIMENSYWREVLVEQNENCYCTFLLVGFVINEC